MNKFIIHTEWIKYFRNLLNTRGANKYGYADYDTLVSAFRLFEEISHYYENGEYSFNETQYREEAMFLSFKPQIDADLELLRRSNELPRKDGDYEHD